MMQVQHHSVESDERKEPKIRLIADSPWWKIIKESTTDEPK